MKKNCFILYILIFVCSFLSCKITVENEKSGVYEEKPPAQDSKGYKYIDEDANLQEEIELSNMIYCIAYEFDLNNQTLTIPENCILSFKDKGLLKNGSIEFNSTYLDGSVKFENVNFSGNLINDSCNLSWFGLNTSLEQENAASDKRKNTAVLTQVLACVGPQLIIDGFYPISSMVTLSKSVSFVGADWNEDLLKSSYDYSYEPKYGFYANGKETRLFTLEKTCNLNIFGVYFKGSPEVFKNAVTTDNLPFTWAFILPTFGSLGSIYNCKIEGFMQGIRGIGGYLEKIQNTTFNACQVGLFTVWTSDFDVFGCKFTNCMPNIEVTMPDENLSANDFNNARHIGCGIWSSCCGMVNYANNYYENNFVDFLTNEADIIINITDSKFVNARLCSLYFYNDYNRQTTPWMSLSPSELHKYAIDNFVITGNTFTSTKNSLANCIALIRDTDLVYLGDSSGTPEKHRNRGMNLIFSGNTFDDKRTNVPETESIFVISNEIDTTGTITCSNNEFKLSKANYFVNLMPSSSGKFSFVNNENSWGETLTANKTNGKNADVIVYLN